MKKTTGFAYCEPCGCTFLVEMIDDLMPLGTKCPDCGNRDLFVGYETAFFPRRND